MGLFFFDDGIEERGVLIVVMEIFELIVFSLGNWLGLYVFFLFLVGEVVMGEMVVLMGEIFLLLEGLGVREIIVMLWCFLMFLIIGLVLLVWREMFEVMGIMVMELVVEVVVEEMVEVVIVVLNCMVGIVGMGGMLVGREFVCGE